mgnify:CR=1 FL=1
MLFAESRWRIPCTSYLLRSAGETVLVDTGVGPAGLWGWDAGVRGRPASRARGGWLPRPRTWTSSSSRTYTSITSAGTPTGTASSSFPNARYVAHRDGIVRRQQRPSAHRADDPGGRVRRDRRRGGRRRGRHGVPAAWALPRAHGSPDRIRGERAVLIADAAVNPMLLDQPDHTYVSDSDAAACAATRRALLRGSSTRRSSRSAATIRHGGIGRVVTRRRPRRVGGSAVSRRSIVFLKHKLPSAAPTRTTMRLARPRMVRLCFRNTKSGRCRELGPRRRQARPRCGH